MDNIERKINDLLIDKNFLKLKNIQNKSNLFEILAVSHKELWHSAFIKWLIDPNSNYGLGVFPLKRFLFTVIDQGKISNSAKKPEISIAKIESKDAFLNQIKFRNEEEIDNGKGKIDIYGENEKIRIIIENKINAKESDNQTLNYYKHYNDKNEKEEKINIFVFLTPDETQHPECKKFIQITYQDICDYVIKPCLIHPNLTQEGKYLLEQYLYNLKNPINERGTIMALANEELCNSIYESHKEVLDEIFLTVRGETPENDKITGRISLTRLKDEGIINQEYSLFKIFKKKSYIAELEENDQGDLQIKYEDKYYDTPSSVAQEIASNKTNGWTFWYVKDKDGNIEGTLDDLRREYLQKE